MKLHTLSKVTLAGILTTSFLGCKLNQNNDQQSKILEDSAVAETEQTRKFEKSNYSVTLRYAKTGEYEAGKFTITVPKGLGGLLGGNSVDTSKDYPLMQTDGHGITGEKLRCACQYFASDAKGSEVYIVIINDDKAEVAKWMSGKLVTKLGELEEVKVPGQKVDSDQPAAAGGQVTGLCGYYMNHNQFDPGPPRKYTYVLVPVNFELEYYCKANIPKEKCKTENDHELFGERAGMSQALFFEGEETCPGSLECGEDRSCKKWAKFGWNSGF